MKIGKTKTWNYVPASDIFSEFYCDTDIRISYEEATFIVEEQSVVEEITSFLIRD